MRDELEILCQIGTHGTEPGEPSFCTAGTAREQCARASRAESRASAGGPEAVQVYESCMSATAWEQPVRGIMTQSSTQAGQA